ncbi:hypothetical protein G6F46_003226 [Rhizopus delemar]|uniref:Rho-GAP domain-containing protein n=2 Tax=Rhizopus TaxID=4842 RepID=A0A9P7CRI1_9FUNG|nr:hypothetical protein G6F55_009761 [Rhizopus delemar]KAG1537156.1 hypothetical protein G6F51_010544 [Rhizopus arrhizus]KAG1501531.1 hypothetical protein G6F54_002975 [Rhizopus delemar]KAG1514269.1 hypothetical protein G6F53_003809 [Rhizopus delemar]KAG1557318.1 hypothetical protein G6F49_005515 [Rhizopus delemar]
MYYSFEFAANVTRSCIEEINRRGLRERKIFRKTVPNYGLFIKVFSKGEYSMSDLSSVDIHSVATLMQAALWSTPDRIISKKAWRKINYETCKLSDLCTIIPKKGEEFLIEILDFLVKLLRYKKFNAMDAYKLGDSLGKVALGPNGCSQIMEEKSGHFLTRLIIEHAKITNHEIKLDQEPSCLYFRVDSGYESLSSKVGREFYSEYRPLCKSQGTQARAKFYGRAISRTNRACFDWFDNITGVQSMLDNDYDTAPDPPEKPWISIFISQDALETSLDMRTCSTLYRILKEAIKPPTVVPLDPFESTYLFNNNESLYQTEHEIHNAFNQFLSLQVKTDKLTSNNAEDRSNPLRKLNSSLSNLKLNIKRYRSRHDLSEDSIISDSTIVNDSNISELEYLNTNQQRQNQHYHHHYQKHSMPNMKTAMKKMMKLAGDRKNNKVLL